MICHVALSPEKKCDVLVNLNNKTNAKSHDILALEDDILHYSSKNAMIHYIQENVFQNQIILKFVPIHSF